LSVFNSGSHYLLPFLFTWLAKTKISGYGKRDTEFLTHFNVYNYESKNGNEKEIFTMMNRRGQNKSM